MTNHLIIGLGGTGGRIVRAFRKNVFRAFKNVNCRPSEDANPVVYIDYLYVDSNNNDLNGQQEEWKVLGDSVALSAASKLHLGNANLAAVLGNLANYPGIAPWLGDAVTIKHMVANTGGVPGANQIRRFGRFLFAFASSLDKNNSFAERLGQLVNGLEASSHSAQTEFHVCCTLACGTGSGSLIDAITQIRQLRPDSNTHPIYVYVLITDKPAIPANTGNFYANQYAALLELNALRLGIFKPHDLKAIQPTRLAANDNFQVAFLISDKNEENIPLEVGQQENLVADFLYQKIVVLRNNLPDLIRKTYTFEDVAMYPCEPAGHLKKRSYFFGSFGIKRYAIPEEEIREKLLYTFSRQAVRQLQYNKWSDATGFLSDTAFDFDASSFVEKTENLEKWCLTDTHLLLENDFMREATQYPGMKDWWRSNIEAGKDAVKSSHKKDQWLNQLDNYAEGRNQLYRTVGVDLFYEGKAEKKTDYARIITSKIEEGLFRYVFISGEYGIEHISKMLDALIRKIERDGTRFSSSSTKDEEGVAKCQTNTETESGNLERYRQSFNNIGLFDLGKSTAIFNNYATALGNKYYWKTREKALGFGKALLTELKSSLQTLKSHVDTFRVYLSEASKDLDAKIEQKVKDTQAINFNDTLVPLMDATSVNQTIFELERNKDTRTSYAHAIRQEILNKLDKDESFAKLVQKMDKTQLFDLLSRESNKYSYQAHQLLLHNAAEPIQPILGISIIEKLYAQYGGVTEQLRQIITKLMTSAVSYLQFENAAIQPNQALNDAHAPNSPQGSITVFLPQLTAAPHLATFREALVTAFRAAIAGTVDIVDTTNNFNEITIVSTRYWFPLRLIRAISNNTQSLSVYYKNKMNVSDKKSVIQQIFLEDHEDHQDLPDLLLLADGAARQQALPYILIADGLGIIELLADPDTGAESAYLIIRNEGGGRPIFPPINLGFKNITEASTRLQPTVIDEVIERIKNKLNEAGYQHQAKKQELIHAINAKLDAIYQERGQNPLDAVYKEFDSAGSKARSIL